MTPEEFEELQAAAFNFEEGAKAGAKAERESIKTLLKLDLLLLKATSPQAFLDRAIQLIDVRGEQEDA
jgi:hypothetical protein